MKNGRYEDNGFVRYYKNGVLHRLDGPAHIWPNGYQAWYVDGQYHRLDGPARIWPNGYQAWYVDGQYHRLDGPAFIRPDGSQEWWVGGREIDITDILGYLPSIPLSEEEQMIVKLLV